MRDARPIVGKISPTGDSCEGILRMGKWYRHLALLTHSSYVSTQRRCRTTKRD